MKTSRIPNKPACNVCPFFMLIALLLLGGARGFAATLVVTNAADDGSAGTLRSIVASAQSGDTIVFDSSLSGGRIVLTNGELTVAQDLTIDASSLAGGVIIDAGGNSRVLEIVSGNTVALDSLILTNGQALSGSWPTNAGGAILVQSKATLTISNCTLSGNSALYGGALCDNGTCTANNCTLSANSAHSATPSYGGGIWNQNTLVLNNCILTRNKVTGSGGIAGGIENYDSTTTMNNCTLSSNSATAGGGGIANQDGGTLTINNSTFFGNSAAYGGGIANLGSTSTSATLNNCTLSGNSSRGNGGGIGNDLSTLTLNNCTLSVNSAHSNGGGIANNGAAALTNTIVAGNTAPKNPDYYKTASSTFSGANYLTSGIPLLAPLGNYGGPTQTMPPLFGSPAIDAGNDSAAGQFATDQRGYPRLSGAHVDIGAAEAQVASAGNPPVLKDSVWTSAGSGGVGTFQFTFTNSPDIDFTTLTATNVALPLTNWTVLGSAIQTAPGQYEFTDPGATNSPQRFYRIVSP